MNVKEKSILNEMKTFVARDDNRSISFTNKEAAFYFTQSHLTNHPEHAYFAGLNIAKNRIFQGYHLYDGSNKLDNQNSKVCVYPYKMMREHGQLTEELWMLDYKNVLEVSLTGVQQQIGIELLGENVKVVGQEGHIVIFSSLTEGWVIAVGSKQLQPITMKGQIIYADAKDEGFYIAAGKTAAEAVALLQDTMKQVDPLKVERVRRMENLLLQNTYMRSTDETLELAHRWMNITMDQLVTRQQGDGIYAGLPWFNEYWGRDQFISMPGAVLVSGQFETARNILLSFAKFQNTDKDSKFFGRIPNILAPENIDYHTTDGTPRFIIQLQDYVKYSGDTEIIKELYPAVINSIQGSIDHWMDEKGYLMHADNETWMDARDSELKSYSPRDTRANDIQALWYNQLLAGVYFAEYMNDQVNAEQWKRIAEQLKMNFEKDYRDSQHSYLADRLDKEGKPEFSLRPNQLFAFDMFDDQEFACQAIRTAWEELVYPWGVASLDRNHPLFHPFHLTHHYHKDAAYHNGAVWIWLNGIAMQRMIEVGAQETAYQLFKNMNWMALNKGVVGGLCENMDAYPQEGENWAKLTGAYLQAWSNAEQLRVWYQYFLGVRPDLINNTLTFAPRIPEEIKDLDYMIKVGNGLITASYHADSTKEYRYQFKDASFTATIDISPFEIVEMEVIPGSELVITQTDRTLKVTLRDGQNNTIKEIDASWSQARADQQERNHEILKDVSFAEPLDLKNHPVVH
ncbi:glycogen debranching enzyme, putative [Paenibacillus uliginis N3/975]|uniref:Glycogen debranching enzyme, putative n=2 Tax=Paenibacillus TaxID=44249 RepID=A0A1X7HQ28_9BACL|nr:glycogen debranching enzyme, putative [Paenibacillus uliginis N3/975]